MNALPLRACGYLPARAMRQAPGSRNVISVVRGQTFGHVRSPVRDCSRPRLAPVRLAAARICHGTEAPRLTRPSRSPIGRILPASNPARGALRSPSFRWRLRLGCPCGPPGFPISSGRGLHRFRRPGRFRTEFPLRPKPSRPPSDPAGCVASCARCQSRCTGG